MKRKRFDVTLWIGLAAAAIALCLPATAHASTNVVPNPGFELGGCGDSTPVLCGWAATDPDTSMSQDTTNPHTGSASMSVWCAYPACDLYYGGMASASMDPAFCAPIVGGAHQASFWYRDAQATAVSLGAAFYATPDCTGSSSSNGLSATPGAGGWQQATGALVAPPGTQSALFSLDVTGGCVGACNDNGPCYCGIGANFDDVYVDDVGDTTPPTISSFTPTSGTEETWVTITGTNFTGATAVAFNGTTTPDFYVSSSTEIVVFVPPAATSGPISVATPFGTATSDASFTVIPSPPNICCLDPTSGPVGTSVAIWGVNLTGATSVTFNGIADPNFVVDAEDLITAHVPPGATTGPVSVTTPGGTATSGPFTVTPSPPTISDGHHRARPDRGDERADLGNHSGRHRHQHRHVHGRPAADDQLVHPSERTSRNERVHRRDRLHRRHRRHLQRHFRELQRQFGDQHHRHGAERSDDRADLRDDTRRHERQSELVHGHRAAEDHELLAYLRTRRPAGDDHRVQLDLHHLRQARHRLGHVHCQLADQDHRHRAHDRAWLLQVVGHQPRRNRHQQRRLPRHLTRRRTPEGSDAMHEP
jgi:hypothetical protein